MNSHLHFTHFTTLMSDFAALESLKERVLSVLVSLPEAVQVDFARDETFAITVERVTRSRSTLHFMACPQGRSVSRCVILRKKLNDAPEAFAKYVIAHEFAHAFLRNGGWGEIADREEAADALAASWGYVRPAL